MAVEDINEDYFTIKEFAGLVGMSADILRHYDNDGLFHCAKRGDGLNNGY